MRFYILKYAGMMACLTACVMMVGCDSGGDDKDSGSGDSAAPAPAPAAATVTGSWRGDATGSVAGQSLNAPTWATLTQNGTSVTGTWENYTVNGSFDGTTLRLDIEPFVESGVTFTGTIVATYRNDQLLNMNGELTGRRGSLTVSGTFHSDILTHTSRMAGRGLGEDSLLDAIVIELMR